MYRKESLHFLESLIMLGIQEASNKNGGCPDDKNKKNLKSFRTVRKLGGTGSLYFLAKASDPEATDGK